MSPALAGGFFTTSATWEAHLCTVTLVKSRGICPLQLTFLGNLHEYGDWIFLKWSWKHIQSYVFLENAATPQRRQ